MPSSVEVDRLGPMRFFLQPRWAPGPYTMDGPARRRTLGSYTELEIELRFDNGSAVGVVYLLPSPHDGPGVFVVTCFEEFFQPLRRLMYGPGDDRARQRLWDRLPQVRPLFMAANANGLLFKYEDVALMQHVDPADGRNTNLVVSADYSRTSGGPLDETLTQRVAGLLNVSIELFEEGSGPLDFASLYRVEGAEVLEMAGAAALWLFKHAGDLDGVFDLLDLLDD